MGNRHRVGWWRDKKKTIAMVHGETMVHRTRVRAVEVGRGGQILAPF